MAALALRKVLVLMGGRSGEHDVSLNTGRSLLAALDRERWEPLPAVVSRDNTEWRFAHPDHAAEARPLGLSQALAQVAEARPDVAFIAMHGPFGEDGRVQALLDLLGLPYVGSDSFASALAMDKPRTKDVYRARGVPTPKAAVLELDGTTPGALAEVVAGKFPSPWVLKTPRLGSSVGVEIVARREDLEGAVLRVAGIDGTLLVEEFVRGREFTAPVLDLKAEGGPRGLPVIEIVIKTAHFFNYQNKYDGSTAEVCPAEIPEELEQRIRAIGVAAHRALGCRGYSRTDVMVTAGGAAYALETNTLPGLTDQSLFPRAARVAGLSYTALVSALLDDALARGPA